MALDELTDLFDLMDLAESNKPLALSRFSQEYASVPFVLSATSSDPDAKLCINLIENTVEINSYNYFKKVINIFGHLVKELRIKVVEFSTFKLTAVYKYIGKHCTSLKSLSICYSEGDDGFEPNIDMIDAMTENPLRISTVFPSLEILYIENIYMKTRMSMNVCFPNLKTLRLVSTAVADPSFIEVNMPNLTNLEIDLGEDEEEFDDDDDDGDEVLKFDRSNIESLIRLNHQLEDVDIVMKMDVPFLKFLRDSLPSLKKLTLALDNCDFDNYNGVDIVFKNVVVFDFDDSGEVVGIPPITSESLTELKITTTQNTFVLDYIKKHPSVKVLHLNCEYSAARVSELISSLPDLKTLHLTIEDDEWTLDDLTGVLTECERFDNAKISIEIDKPQRQWHEALESNWKIEEDHFTDSYTFEKKTSG